jgi:hypothetical protein
LLATLNGTKFLAALAVLAHNISKLESGYAMLFNIGEIE